MFDKLIIALISPLGTALLLGALAWLLAGLRWRRAAMGLGAVALLWLYTWSLPMPSFWLRQHVEASFPPVPVAQLPVADAIVVLGGAMSAPRGAQEHADLTPAADRVWHAARLYHAGKAPVLVLSGGRYPRPTDRSEAEAMQAFLRDLGVPAAALLPEDRSINTRENARFTADLLQARGQRRVLLVTSALHMRRAKLLFEAEGLQVTAAATDHEVQGEVVWSLLPGTTWLDGSGRAMKELLGRWSGR